MFVFVTESGCRAPGVKKNLVNLVAGDNLRLLERVNVDN